MPSKFGSKCARSPEDIWIFTTRQRSCGKVMFSVMSVCWRGSHMAITHDVLDLTEQGPQPSPDMELHCTGTPLNMGPHYKDPPVPALLDMEPYCTWTPSHAASDILWPSLETCSNLFTSGSLLSPSVEIWWLLKQVRSAQAGGIQPAFRSGKSQGISKRLEKSGKNHTKYLKMEFQTHVISYF